MELPSGVRSALNLALDEQPVVAVMAAVRAISERYRLEHGQVETAFLGSPVETLAYTAYRMPATFAALTAVLREAQQRRPEFQPKTMLDVGAGPGTSAHAAGEVWPSLVSVTAIERDVNMVRLGEKLATASRFQAVRSMAWRHQDLIETWPIAPADLTVAGYLLGEMSMVARSQFIARLWERTTGISVLVEPGTPRGYAHIRSAGEELSRAGAHLIAPFPANWICVERADDWCHFSVRVPRTSFLRRAKGGELPYEDEKFAYLVASRAPGLPIAARVIRHPQVRSGHVRLVLCTPAGVRRLVVSRSQGEIYRHARRLAWGDALSSEEVAAYDRR